MSVPVVASLDVAAKTAGTNSPISATTSSAAFEPAIFGLNLWVPWRSPPISTLAPSTSSRFPMIEPVSDAFTTSIRPACSAKNEMISSAMLPNVALRIPPTCGPVSDPRRSVDSPTTQASPRIAAADTTKITVLSACANSSRIATTLTRTVTSTAIRAVIDSCPRIGMPERPAGVPVAAVMGRC